MDEFLNSSIEARTLLDNSTDDSPKTRASTISQVKGKITSFQRYRVVMQNKAALIKKLWWRPVACTAKRDVVQLIQEFDLLGANCKRLEKEAADEVAIGVDRNSGTGRENGCWPRGSCGTNLMSQMRSCKPSSSMPCPERLETWLALF